MNFKLILIVVLACMAAVFVVQNVAVVEIYFLSWRGNLSSFVDISHPDDWDRFLGILARLSVVPENQAQDLLALSSRHF